MKLLSLPILFLVFRLGEVAAEDNSQQTLMNLENRLGGRVWSGPEKRLVRATIYKMGSAGKDSNSKSKKSNEKVRLHYGAPGEVGTVAAPYWLPHGSLVKLQTGHHKLLFLATDVGGSVERGDASKKIGKTKEQRRAPVLDFCVKKQFWPDFVVVDLYYYAGKLPFNELRKEDQAALFLYAKKYFTSGK